MRSSNVGAYAVSCCATVAMLAGCGGSQSPIGALRAMPPSAVSAAALHPDRSWMAPEAKNDDLLYVSDDADRVYVFSYPAGKLVGTLGGFSAPAGLCSNEAGDVFVANAAGQDILEYAHGSKKPVATLNDFGYYPNGCSVDPTTGNVAVTNYAKSKSFGAGSVAIYAGALGSPTLYTDAAFNAYLFCGYDSKGNLFIDGTDSGTTKSLFAELPAGSSSFADITLNKTIGYPGGVQWDGQDVAIKDSSTNALYRVKVTGTSGKVVGTDRFDGQDSTLIVQFWIQGHTIILPYSPVSRRVRRVGFWPYPGGGSPTKVLGGIGAAELVGTTVSLAK
jgi:DNA-binding beta-propeller fold protein YncE